MSVTDWDNRNVAVSVLLIETEQEFHRTRKTTSSSAIGCYVCEAASRLGMLDLRNMPTLDSNIFPGDDYEDILPVGWAIVPEVWKKQSWMWYESYGDPLARGDAVEAYRCVNYYLLFEDTDVLEEPDGFPFFASMAANREFHNDGIEYLILE